MNALMIRPILPRIPRIEEVSSADTAMTILTFTMCLVLAGLTAFLVSRYAAEHFKENKKKTALAFIGIAVTVGALLLCFFGCAVGAVKGILFCLILAYSSYSDIKTRESDDYLAVMVALTAFIGREVSDIPGMLLSAVLATIPMLLVLIICKGKAIGGADMKLTAACAFLLGLCRGIVGLIAGLTIGIIANLIIQSKKDKSEGFPMIPYLAVGFMAAYFI